MKITVETLKERGFKEMPSGNWIKTTTGGNAELIEPSLVAKPEPPKAPKEPKPLMNSTEARYLAVMVARGYAGILAQAITLRLDPPFKSYRPDFFYIGPEGGWRFVEVKAPHRFAEKGIAKAALAAKTYPQFTFELAMWKNKKWNVTVLTP